jgi:hypothetical protein
MTARDVIFFSLPTPNGVRRALAGIYPSHFDVLLLTGLKRSGTSSRRIKNEMSVTATSTKSARRVICIDM